MRRRASRLSPWRSGSFHELDEDEVRVEISCVDESELDVVVELLGVDSTDWRSGGTGRGRAVRGGDSFGFTEPRSVADEARRRCG